MRRKYFPIQVEQGVDIEDLLRHVGDNLCQYLRETITDEDLKWEVPMIAADIFPLLVTHWLPSKGYLIDLPSKMQIDVVVSHHRKRITSNNN